MLITDVTILHETRCSTVKADIVGTSQEFGEDRGASVMYRCDETHLVAGR